MTFPIYYSPDGDVSPSGGDSGASQATLPASGANASSAGQTSSNAGAFDIRQHTDDAGAFKPDWWKAAGVSENLGKKFTRPEALARSYESLESKISAKGIIPPGPNATQDERNAFYKALGRPDKPEDYAFQKPEKIGDQAVPDAAWDANRAAKWQNKLHEIGVPKDQAQKIVEAAIGESVEGMSMISKAQQQIVAQGKDALNKEWGSDYDKNLGAAQRAAEQFGFPKDHPGGNDPHFLKFLAKVGNAIGERPGANVRTQSGENRLSPAEARTEAEQLTRTIIKRSTEDRQWANSAEAAQLKARKTALFQIAHPEK